MANFDRKRALLSLLSDGSLHSGQSLAEELQVTRTAVWKHIQSLQTLGVEIGSVRGSGYQLSNALELLDEAYLTDKIKPGPDGEVKHMEVFFETESTNQVLLDKLISDSIHRNVALAEFQTLGRGRRGNQWLSPVASGLCLSMGWRFEVSPASLMALSLASGVAVIQALEKFNIEKLGLKWPNDIICDGRKLGGILLESRIEAAGTCDVVLGLGLNMRLSDKTVKMIEQPSTDIVSHCNEPPSRNELATDLIHELVMMFERYAKSGFSPFIDDWRKNDYLRGKQAVLNLVDEKLEGKVLGIADNGLLQMRLEGQTREFTSGELSIRVIEDAAR